MIRKRGYRLSGKIMLNQEPRGRWRFNLIPLRSRVAIRRDWRGTAEALAIGAIGGLAFGWLGLPAGYLSGAMLAVALASLAGRPLKVPSPLVHITSAVIGITLGSVASAGLIHGV